MKFFQIGLLRNGKLLAEDPPYKLMEKCSCDNLEEAFLKLSITQEDHDVEEVSILSFQCVPKLVISISLIDFFLNFLLGGTT